MNNINEFLSYYNGLRYRLESEVLTDEIKNKLALLNIPYEIGQRRLVIDAPDNQNTCLKIAHCPEGMKDNKNDLATSWYLSQLSEDGTPLLNKLAGRVVLSVMTAASNPSIIRVQKVSPMERNTKVKDYMQRNGISYLKEGIISFIANDANLAEDAYYVTDTITKYCIACDISDESEPDNKGLVYSPQFGREVNTLLDIGSVVPMLDSSYDPKCPICGSKLVYNVKRLTPTSQYINRNISRGSYTCTKYDCANNLRNRSSYDIPAELIDSVVFSKYNQEAFNSLEAVRAIASYEYTPNVPCRNINEYWTQLQNNTPQGLLQYFTNEILNHMWDGYVKRVDYYNYANYKNIIISFRPSQAGYQDSLMNYSNFANLCVAYLQRFIQGVTYQMLVEKYMESYIKTAYGRYMRSLTGINPLNGVVTTDLVNVEKMNMRSRIQGLDDQSIEIILIMQ